MHALHIAVTALMAACGLAALVARFGPVPDLMAISFYLGLWVIIAAVLIALVVGLVLIVRIASKNAAPFLKQTWLALANGIVGLAFLAWFAVHVS
jgi:hypothetical protein